MQAPSRDAVLDQVATFQAPLRDLQIHGVAVLMILGVAMRLFPAMFSLAEVPARRGWTALGVLSNCLASAASWSGQALRSGRYTWRR